MAKKIEELYKKFLAACRKASGMDIKFIKVPLDRLDVQVGKEVRKMDFLDALVASGLASSREDAKNRLEKAGFRWARGKKLPVGGYLIPPGTPEQKSKSATSKKKKRADLQL